MSQQHKPTPQPTKDMPVQVHHRTGDLFSWGAGVAAVFQKKYPIAYRIYEKHCDRYSDHPDKLVGTTLLIPPQREGKGRETRDWIGCLFTRENFGSARGKSQDEDVADIVDATGYAWADLLKQVADVEAKHAKGESEAPPVGEIVMPRINGGIFQVPWEKTEEKLRTGGKGWYEGLRRECWVYTPEE